MSIEKNIFQTYKSNRLPWVSRWHISQLKKRNPEYEYKFFDDEQIKSFIHDEYGLDILNKYLRINIGAAKADFFRYAALYKKGGVYLDIDSLILEKIDVLLHPDDKAVIALEGNEQCYVQYALFYESNHPFLERTIELILKNIDEGLNLNDVHCFSGPTIYSQAVNELKDNSEFREMGIDYDNKVMFSYPMSKTFLYGLSRKNHWKEQLKIKPILKQASK